MTYTKIHVTDTDNRDLATTGLIFGEHKMMVEVDPKELYKNLLMNCSGNRGIIDEWTRKMVDHLTTYVSEVGMEETDEVSTRTTMSERFQDFITYLQTVEGLDNDAQ